MKYCTDCGSEVNKNQKYCTKCGKDLLNNQNNNMKIKEYKFSDPTSGGKAIIRLGEASLSISRPGILSKFSNGFTGEKTILYNQISSVQIKKAGMARGYIQFILPGSKEAKSGVVFGDSKDENIIYFSSGFNNEKVNKAAEDIKRTIENYNLNSNKGSTIIKEDDKYDKLNKLKQLLDNNVISQEEFDKEKEKLLNN